MKPTSRLTFGLASLALFVLLALVHTWPLATAPGRLSRNDTHDTVFGAHRLGSASVLIGATRLTTLCRELESLHDDALNDRGRDLVARIDHESTAVMSAIAALLTPSRTPG